jgi:hypothetical protein
MPSVGVQLSRVCPVCVPCVSRLPPGPSSRYLCLFVRPRVPSVCPVRVSRLPPVSLYGTVPGVCPGLPTVSYRLPGTGTVPGTVQYTFY